jgi:hypothetical protein
MICEVPELGLTIQEKKKERNDSHVVSTTWSGQQPPACFWSSAQPF